LGHGGDVCVLGIRKVRPGRAVKVADELGYLADAI
jgi:hypothetical protein